MTNLPADPELKNSHSDLRQNLAETSKVKSKAWNIAFGGAMVLSLLGGEWLWLARAGWTLLALMFVVDLRYAFYALFFYAAWFHGTGFMLNLPFTLKHLHLAAILALTAQTVSGNFSRDMIPGAQQIRRFSWVLAVLGIGLMNFFRFDMPAQALRSPLNILAVIGILIYLFALLEKFSLKRTEMIQRGLSFFLVGVGLQVLIAFQNTVSGSNYLNMPLIHNNHMGILCAFSSFLGIGVYLAEKRRERKRLWGIITLIIISAAIASCSRTAWFSFAGSALIFFSMSWRQRAQGHCQGLKKRHLGLAVLLFSALTAVISLINPEVRIRVISLPQLVDPVYLKYTLKDVQNFGFLGIFRLLQTYTLHDILLSQPFLGVGFTRQIMDFHGFYFCILGATGFIGLFMMAAFIRQTLLDALKSLSTAELQSLFFLRLGAFCAFTTLLFCSFLETYIVQFSSWITLWALLALTPSVNPRTEKLPHE